MTPQTCTTPRAQARTHRPRWCRAFLVALAQLGNISAACHAVGVPRRTVYAYRAAHADYAAAWCDALAEAADHLEAEARRRAVEGVEVAVYGMVEGQRQQIGTTRRYSDRLLMLLLAGARPELYRSR